MCCFFPCRDLNHARRKALWIQFSTLFLLPIVVSLLYLSTVQNTPWFRLAIQKQSQRVVYKPYTPLSMSFVGISSPSLFHKEELGKTALELEKAGLDNRELMEQLNPINLFSLPRNSSDTLILMVWGLQSISLTIPSLFVESRTLRLDQLYGDPLISTALSLSGFYDAVVDAKGAAALVLALGEWSMAPAVLALSFLIIWILTGCIKRATRRSDYTLDDHSTMSNERLINDSVDSTIESNAAHTLWTVGFPSSLPFAIVGALSLVSAVCSVVGLIVWSTRSLVDANHIMLGIARLIGESAVRWLAERSAFEVDLGLVEYVTAVVLLVFIAFINLCSDFRMKRQRNRSNLVGYQPPQLGRSDIPRIPHEGVENITV